MAKTGMRAQKAAPRAAEQDSSTTYSTRLTPDQKAVVDEAASIKGWTPSNLIRVAAVERAVHVVNTVRPTKFKFGDLSDTIAEQLCWPKLRYFGDISGDEYASHDQTPLVNGDPSWSNPESEPIYCQASRLKLEQVRALRQAVQLGGLEFVEAVLQECERRLQPEDPALPDPIDPATLT